MFLDIRWDKEIKRHTSQPILNWFHRKISGNKQNSRKRHGKKLSNSTNQADRETRLHADETPSRVSSTSGRRNPHVHVSGTVPRRVQSSGDALDAENEEPKGYATLSVNSHAGSLGPSSSWSAKEPGEADEDASIRPIWAPCEVRIVVREKKVKEGIKGFGEL